MKVKGYVRRYLLQRLFGGHNIELSSAAAISRSSTIHQPSLPVQAALKASTPTICWTSTGYGRLSWDITGPQEPAVTNNHLSVGTVLSEYRFWDGLRLG